MSTFIVENMREGYIDICRWVRDKGWPVSPCDKSTREIVGAQLRLMDPLDALPVGVNRKLNTRFAAVEACQLIAGRSFPGLMIDINPNMEQFLEDGKFHGAYGPRIRSSVRSAVEKLKQDPESRQALVNIWNSKDDLYVRTKDVPCTLTLQWMIRNDRLWAFTSMRSNDVWWGLAYDAFQFTQLQVTIAHVLGIEPGPYVHTANSLHAYDRDWDAIEDLKVVGVGKPLKEYPQGIPGPTMEHAQNLANRILMSNANGDDTVNWYMGKIHGA